MIIKFNPTGTHIYKGFLKVRLDLYPDIGDETYPLHYVDQVDSEGNLTGLKQLNPCLCHFLKIDPAISITGLIEQVKAIFDKATLTSLDYALSSFNADVVSQIMRDKLGTGKKVVSADIDALNTKLTSLEVMA